MGRPTNSLRILYYIILGAYCLYAALYIVNTTFVLDGTRYFTLLDDAMISMRYAENLAAGHGPVFNPGDPPVEGYTNPLWMLYMALLHLLPIATAKLSLLVQITGLLLGLATLVVVKRLADFLDPRDPIIPLAAVALTAFYLPLNTYNLQGMEVSLLAFGVTLATLLAVRVVRDGGSLLPLFALLGLMTLARMDAVIPAAVLSAYLFWQVPHRRREILGWGLLCIGGVLAALTAFRYWYYGDLLPNTYYLKMTGYPSWLRIERGFSVFINFLNYQLWLPFLLPFIALFWIRRHTYLLLISLVFAQVAYSLYVGGDVWDWWGGANRFLSAAMPLFFVAFSFGLSAVIRRFMPARGKGQHSFPVPARRAFIAAAAVALLLFNMIHGPKALAEWALLDRPLHWVDNANMVRRANLVKALTAKDATIAVTWAGAIPYFTGRPTVDLLGKTDRRVAHSPAADRPPFRAWSEFLPGHMKWDYSYSIGMLQPDVIVQLWGSATAAAPWMRDNYDIVRLGPFIFSLRKGAETIRWQQLAEIQRRILSDTRS